MRIHDIVGANVRLTRERHGWSQERLATATGLHRTYISGIERGVRNPTIEILAKLAEALGVEPSDLVRPARSGRR